MALPIDFSLQRPKSSHPFSPLHFSRFLSTIADQKQTRFPVNVPNPMLWRQFPPSLQCDHKYPFNPSVFDHMNALSSRSKTNSIFTNPINRLIPPANHLFSGPGSKSSWSSNSENAECPQQIPQICNIIRLQTGMNKRMDEVTENDLWSSTVANEDFSPHWSEIIHISHNFDKKKCNLIFASKDKQITYSSEIHRPFFVKTIGWCSIFPTLTEKIFGVSCLALEIGHVCLTLKRKRKQSWNTKEVSSKKRCKESPKSNKSTSSN